MIMLDRLKSNFYCETDRKQILLRWFNKTYNSNKLYEQVWTAAQIFFLFIKIKNEYQKIFNL